MDSRSIVILVAMFAFLYPTGARADSPLPTKTPEIHSAAPGEVERDSITEGSVTVDGKSIRYRAIAGTLTVGSTNEIDAFIGTDGRWISNAGMKPPSHDDP